MRMGVWTENLSLPAVLNECLLQSHDGVIRLFPNTLHLGKAKFRDLRAAGAFLVSASWDGKTVSDIALKSEKGARARIAHPWISGKASVRETVSGTAIAVTERQGILEFRTAPGASYVLRPA
jgi:alpha-L-fucosidase 2